MKQKWTGVYSFDAENAETIPENSPVCELHLEFDDEQGIEGHLIDQKYHALTEGEVSLKGFIDENFLSLVATYPVRMVLHESGEHVLNLEETNHEVSICAERSEDGKEMFGSFEEIERSIMFGGAVSDVFRIGFFKATLQ